MNSYTLILIGESSLGYLYSIAYTITFFCLSDSAWYLIDYSLTRSISNFLLYKNSGLSLLGLMEIGTLWGKPNKILTQFAV